MNSSTGLYLSDSGYNPRIIVIIALIFILIFLISLVIKYKK